MQLSQDAITQAAMNILRQYGLADVSMRRLATSLGVAPGALYWHIESKQELISNMAAEIVRPVLEHGAPGDPAELSALLRRSLLSVRDGAEVAVAAIGQPGTALRGKLVDAFAAAVAGWVGGTRRASASEQLAAANGLLHLTLGAASVEQSGAQLAAATGSETAAELSPVEAEAQHRTAVQLLLRGLGAVGEGV
ncbi:helix-turn-helix domain-containing protein [Corynebacterium sp. Q4381]|uniref:TetR/AcrR family transcriptional regulator n=1 Tax=Corynebacterium sp. Marseille-Q4381 TaxID=3121597 RepID=UPI002FE5150F